MPFLSFKSFVTSAKRCAKLTDQSAFWKQANSTDKWALPQYVFYTPDQVRGSISFQGKRLARGAIGGCISRGG